MNANPVGITINRKTLQKRIHGEYFTSTANSCMAPISERAVVIGHTGRPSARCFTVFHRILHAAIHKRFRNVNAILIQAQANVARLRVFNLGFSLKINLKHQTKHGTHLKLERLEFKVITMSDPVLPHRPEGICTTASSRSNLVAMK